jgi:hypothetical protein
MKRLLDWWLTAPLFASLWIGGVGTMAPSLATPPGTNMAEGATKLAFAGPFASPSEAEVYLRRTLPSATAANPKYRTPGADYARRWLTKAISFHKRENGGIVVSTREIFEDTRHDARGSEGTHESTFAVDDVKISDESADDIAESGEKARGVLFRCIGAPCIRAVWSGQKSLSAQTDIYIQDTARRERILAAFRTLQRKAKSR